MRNECDSENFAVVKTKRATLTKRLTVRLSERHYSELCLFALEEGFDPAAVIRHLVARFVQERDRAFNAKFRHEVLGDFSSSPRPSALVAQHAHKAHVDAGGGPIGPKGQAVAAPSRRGTE